MILGGMNSTPSVSENGAISADETQGWCFREKGQYGTAWKILIIWDCLKNNMGFTKYRESQHYCLVCVCAQVLRCVLWISGSSVCCLDVLFKMKKWLFFGFLIKKRFFFTSFWREGIQIPELHWHVDFYSSRILAVADHEPSGVAEDSRIDQWNSWATTTPAH